MKRARIPRDEPYCVHCERYLTEAETIEFWCTSCNKPPRERPAKKEAA